MLLNTRVYDATAQRRPAVIGSRPSAESEVKKSSFMILCVFYPTTKPANATRAKMPKTFVQQFNKRERRLFDFHVVFLSFLSKPRSSSRNHNEKQPRSLQCHKFILSSFLCRFKRNERLSSPRNPTQRYSFPPSYSDPRLHSDSARHRSRRTRTGSLSSPGCAGSWEERRGRLRLVRWKSEMERAGGRKSLLRTS